jgi:myo-inositol-1(or 4)-monophosphatase
MKFPTCPLLPMPDPLEVCLEAARAGGRALLDWQDRFTRREKGRADFVTEADLASQEAIRRTVRKAFPDHDFLGEEDAADRKAKGLSPIPERQSAFRWIVDPLDGTTNYIHRLPGYAVSIALQRHDKLILGVVFDPLSEDCFLAQRGQGATLNGSPIMTSRCPEAREAMVAVSFSPHVTRQSPEIQRFIEILLNCQSVRRMGSAALNLSYVAAGRLDAYLATSVSIWDVAAGCLLVEEAGGSVTSIHGTPLSLDKPELIAAASTPLADELVSIANPATPA